MSIWLVAPPALWGVEKLSKTGHWSYFDLQRSYLGASADSFPAENLALRALESACRSRGLPLYVLNAQTENHRTLEQTWGVLCEAEREHGAPALIGFTGTAELFGETCRLAALAKQRWPRARTVLGHDFATLNAQRILAGYPEFDYVIRGDGFEALPELAALLLQEYPVEASPGLVYRDGAGAVHANPIRPAGDAELPLPTRSDLPRALAMGMSASVFTALGCPYRCIYCTTGAKSALAGAGAAYRQRSVESVVAEISRLVKDHGIDRVTITDDLFVTPSERSRERAAEIARQLRRRLPGLRFMIDCRIDSIDRDLFPLLAEAGLYKVFVGVETAHETQLAYYGKKYRSRGETQASLIRTRICWLQDLGITVIPGIITYHPEVTKEELELTAELIDLCGYRATYQYWSKIVSYPGTPLWERYRSAGHLESDWPLPEWRFRDPAAAAHYRWVKTVAREHRLDFERVRAAFRAALAHWDGSESHVA